MRSLQECQAEVFRRSEKRIREKKRKQKAILAVCSSFVLCMTALFLIFLQPMQPKGGIPPAAGEKTEQVEENFAMLERVEVSCPGFSQTHTQPGVVSAIVAQLEAFENSWESGQGDVEESNEAMPPEASGDNHSSVQHGEAVYTVVYVHANGERTRYTLAGNILTNETKEVTCVMSPDQVQTLLELLGIPGL